jgi:electron transport complex protein RnfB
MLSAILIFLGLAVVFGLLLGYASVKFKIEGDPIVEKVDEILPQTQCGQCGYPGCKPYAEAVAKGEADVNLCIPGGEEVMLKIAEITGREPKEMAETPEKEARRMVAYIHEDQCIGCMLCIKECPVDAIIGTTKMMHTVIVDECTGCEKCIPVCPVDCIDMVPVKETPKDWVWPDPEKVLPKVIPQLATETAAEATPKAS